MKDIFFVKRHGFLSHCFAFNPSVPSPHTVSFSNALQTALKGFEQTAGGFFGLNAQFQPQYENLQLANTYQSLFGGAPPALGSVPGTVGQQIAASGQLRGADVAQAAQYGPQATQAILGSNPWLQQGLNNPLLNTITSQAQANLGLGGAPTAEELQAVDQSTLGSAAAMGTQYSPGTIGQGAINRDLFTQQVEAQRLQQAQQAQQLLMGQNQFTAGVFDPFQNILGRSSQNIIGTPTGVPATMAAGQNMFDPQAALANAQSNAFAQNQAGLAQAQINAGLWGDVFQSIGTAVGGIAGGK